MTGMISRLVRPLYLVSHYMTGAQNDMLMWLMSEAQGVERSVDGFARRLFGINLASIHSTSLESGAIPSLMMRS